MLVAGCDSAAVDMDNIVCSVCSHLLDVHCNASMSGVLL